MHKVEAYAMLDESVVEEDRVEYEEVFLKQGFYFIAVCVSDSAVEEVISLFVETIYIASAGDAEGHFVV